jgi:hypothetical protein
MPKKTTPITPDPQDIEAVWQEAEYADLSDAEKYRLAQATKLIRLYGREPAPPKKRRSAR